MEIRPTDLLRHTADAKLGVHVETSAQGRASRYLEARATAGLPSDLRQTIEQSVRQLHADGIDRSVADQAIGDFVCEHGEDINALCAYLDEQLDTVYSSKAAGGISQEPAASADPVDFQQIAIGLANNGFRVFPLVLDDATLLPDKRKAPAITGWKDLASSDAGRIAAWWSGPYRNHNIGIATGRGLMVLDCDAKQGKAGLQSLAKLEEAIRIPRSRRVRTPSGGVHVYLAVPKDVAISNSVDAIPGYPGVDVRGDGGLVVAPGSFIEGYGKYVDLGGQTEPAPQELIDLCRMVRSRSIKAETRDPVISLDSAPAIERARNFLELDAPHAVEGDGGDFATYKVAATVREFGISESICLDLMLEHWNEAKAHPPWSPYDLQTKVENAYRYAAGYWGGRSAEADFDPVPVGLDFLEPPKKETLFGAEWLTPFDPTKLPKREWVLGRFLAKGYLTGLVAPSGAGKTTLEISMALAIAAGRPDIVGLKHVLRQRVFLWNQEDELVELKRRVSAVMRAFGLSWSDLETSEAPMLLLGSGVDRPLVIAKRKPSGRIGPSEEQAALIGLLKANNVGVAMMDPFVEMHQAEENDNVEIAAVAQAFRAIAVQAHCALLLVHHTRKPPSGDSSGHAGNMDSARGAGALIGVTRMGATLYSIDDRTAKEHGVADTDRHLYVRFDDGKGNMSLISGRPSFFKRESINIGTFEDPEEVGVLRPVELKQASKTKRNSEDLLLSSIRTLLEAEGRISVLDAARTLIQTDLLYEGDGEAALKRRIERVFEKHPPADMALRPEHWPGANRPKTTIVRLQSANQTPAVIGVRSIEIAK